ncbi:MAG: flagellar biosynthesis anti-sigma factor FlgM [Clostridiales bacterium]|jgi:negative regulator of flagellin synthesis FlgM|nr:flagellar biosynthesis anti-sigma factor FlgM [Clostridiales bacterium]
MNINEINKSNPINLYRQNPRTDKVRKEGAPSVGDSVTLSETGNAFRDALKAVKDMPEIRADKVSELARRVKNNEYKTKTSDIADKIIDDSITE